MELSPSDKGRIEHQFDSFCKLVLVCEMKDYKKMILRKMAKEILFSELILIYGYDLEHKKVGQEEIKDIFSIKVMGFDITIKNMLIAEAVLSLTEKGRNIVFRRHIFLHIYVSAEKKHLFNEEYSLDFFEKQ